MIKFLDLQKVTHLHGAEISEAMQRVVDSGRYLQGEENRLFEKEYAAFLGQQYCVGCANGLDAITLIYKAYIQMGMMKPGDEVIVPANTFIASILGITRCGLTPILVEPRQDTLEIDDSLIRQHITPRTRSLLLVHLYGRCAYTEAIADICEQNNLLLVEDNAQAHGCKDRHGRRTGSLGHAAAHSFYPGKNLGALGDAGAVTTNDSQLADIVRALGNYGSASKYVFKYQGVNSRLDEVQAAMLRVKLRYLDADNERRCSIARRYMEGITSTAVTLPQAMPEGMNVFHLFPIMHEDRDGLQAFLADNGVETLIHYPIAPHRQECYPQMNLMSLPVTEYIHAHELSLPISPVMTDEEADTVIQLINKY